MKTDSSVEDIMESYYAWVGGLLILALTLKYLPNYISPLSATPVQTPTTEERTALKDDPDVNGDSSTFLKQQEQAAKLQEFASFQKWYIIIFLLVMLADWMQGPYVYKLYSAYNIPTQDIAILFIIGFGASGITGAFIGSLADKFGRRNMCTLFCVLYSISCATKHWHEYNILIIGRFLGGFVCSLIPFSAGIPSDLMSAMTCK